MALSPIYFPLLLSMILVPFCVTSQRWNIGATLSTDSSPWFSRSRGFAFGFSQIDDATYLLTIWYANIPDTIVWYAGSAPKGSKLRLTEDKGLVLSNPQGERLWASNVSAGRSRYCILSDNGNLLVKDIDNITLWQSFDDPTDTLLPTQRFRALLDPTDTQCGYNSIRQLVNDGPKCVCPPRYSLVDPNNADGNCKPDFKQGSGEENGYRLETLPGTNWPTLDYDMLKPFTEDDCKKSCLNDFYCAAVIYNTEKQCWKKGLPLVKGQRYESDTVTTAFLKVSDANDGSTQNPVLPHPNISKHWKGMNPLVSSFLGTSVFANLVLFGAILGILFFRSRRHRASHMVQKPTEKWNHMTSNLLVTCYDYKELEEATDGFKEELGRGACAIVYKGLIGCPIDGSQVPVAVKKIDRAWLRESDNELKTELNVIGQTHHKNLVRLIGFCEEEKHRLLVYEFMSNGCLADLLFGETRPGWEARVQIARGIARGLLYLHEECSSQIIHCDIKPQNILLDEFLVPHISDFGLSKLLMINQFQTRTAIRGTKGYVAPEWFSNKPVTVKVDVYSYGVLLLEIISCRRCVNMEASEEGNAILTDWAFDCYQMGDLQALVIDEMEALDDKESLERFLKVALWCAQDDPKLRPTMRQVTLMLEGVVKVPNPPYPNQDCFSVVSF